MALHHSRWTGAALVGQSQTIGPVGRCLVDFNKPDCCCLFEWLAGAGRLVSELIQTRQKNLLRKECSGVVDVPCFIGSFFAVEYWGGPVGETNFWTGFRTHSGVIRKSQFVGRQQMASSFSGTRIAFFASRALVDVQPSVTEKEKTEKKHCTEPINMATE